MQKDWLDDISVGDTVVISGPHGSTGSIGKVERLTKTMIIIGHRGSTRFSRKDGWAVGYDGWSRPHLMEPTPKLLEKIRREKLIDNCSYLCNKKILPLLSTEDLVAIYNILKKGREEDEKNK